MSDAIYIHGTDPSEQARLAGLNRLTNAAFVEFLDIMPGMRVLDVGSGLGILAAEVAAAAPVVQVIGVERSAEQIAQAPIVPNVSFRQGDAHELDFPNEYFDLAYARYLLEHVRDPERVLREMRRVVRAGGRVAVCENDISIMRIDPALPTFEQVWSTFAAHQASLGGDALIGRRLYRLFRAAGFTNVELSTQPELHWHGSPGFEGWIDNLVGNVEGARTDLIKSGRCSAAQLDAAVNELTSLKERDDASVLFHWNRASARK